MFSKARTAFLKKKRSHLPHLSVHNHNTIQCTEYAVTGRFFVPALIFLGGETTVFRGRGVAVAVGLLPPSRYASFALNVA